VTGTFIPNITILPPAQRRLWSQMAATVDLGFVLYGGTAIALRLGHRTSVDFDFFSTDALDRGALRDALPFLKRATVLQDQPDTWTVLTADEAPDSPTVKLSFFGGTDFGRVGEPDVTDDGVLQVAALDDLMATKVKVVLQRVEAKDYRDVAAMTAAGVSLSRGLAAARVMFGPAFQPSEALKALTYFEDGDLETLSGEDRRRLIEAVRAVRDLPDVSRASDRLERAVRRRGHEPDARGP